MEYKEEDLFLPVKEYLEDLGFKIDAEVNNCDIVGTSGSEIIIVELKKRFSLKLIYQALERQAISPFVYVAVGTAVNRQYPPDIDNIKKLLKKLNLGLLVIHMRLNGTSVEPLLDPADKGISINGKKRIELLKELDGRYKNFNTGGAAGNKKKMTAYFLNSIQIAVILKYEGPLKQIELQQKGTAINTSSILINNYNGWFKRIKRGLYGISKKGEQDLKAYPEQVKYFTNKLKKDKI